ncbi:MAG: urate hydroxylase PuuD [Acidobacteriota bacterium]
MLPVSFTDLPFLLIQGKPFKLPDDFQSHFDMALMWLHFIAGIIWIGHLYFLNFVNVNLMKVLDGPTKSKLIPQLMPRVFWWFRWGAVITVFVGITYYAMFILGSSARNARSGGMTSANTWLIFFIWLVIVCITFAVTHQIIHRVDNGSNGWIIAILVGVVITLMGIGIVKYMDGALANYASNKVFSIGIGGGMGVIMMLNVWGIIWPNQKRIIGWTYENAEKGTAIPAESAKLARKALLASRMNLWLSIPMLFLMRASTHFTMFGQ